MTAILENTRECDEALKREKMFDEFVQTLRIDQLQLDAGVASKEKQALYEPLINGDYRQMAINNRNYSSLALAKDMAMTFAFELGKTQLKPNKLAMQLSTNGILVWATINDNDEDTEDAIYIAEAKANAEFYKYGLHLSATVLEESDNYPIPEQYKEIKF